MWGSSGAKHVEWCFYHEEKDIALTVHGDDFTVLGDDTGLDWFRAALQSKFLLKVRGRLGPEATDDKEIRILNRIVRWTPEGIWYEPDQRHAEIIIRDLGLERESKGVGTAG